MHRLLTAAALLLTVACACDRPAQQHVTAPHAPSDGTLARVLQAYTDAFNRGALSEVLALMSDDVVAIGMGACKGAPCVGRQAIQAGYLEDTLKRKFARKNI